jgi:2-amino-4-hydroxy-6-hydroxymethyldihydropteridine diphosphokinase
VYLSLGSNLGDRERHLQEACSAVKKLLAGFRMSDIYETLPLYVTDQNRFLNMVVSGIPGLEPDVFLRRIQSIEREMGRDRKRSPTKGPRVIDIDILLYGSRVVSTEALRIPHPGIAERQFVLIPLLQLSPGLRDPVTNASYAEISRRLPDQGVYIFSSRHYNTHAEPE